jgi:general secretion pathway protein A
MYKKFFALTRSPFDIPPDPYFLCATSRHREALASIVHGVMRRKGFMVLTGEVGTGKTLVVRCLMELLRTRGVATANVFNPRLRSREFLVYIIGDLGMKAASPDNKGILLLQLYNYLIARQRANQTTVLIVDEAQNMATEILEEIRLLTNLETAQQKLLQIVLVGQPELDQKLDSNELRQLKQRIALRCHLEPLQELETRGYVWKRLQRAGANSSAPMIFPLPVIAAVHRHSHGIPRLVNTICENALIAAYAAQSKAVTEEMIEEVADDLRLRANCSTPGSERGGQVNPDTLARSLHDFTDALERVSRASTAQRYDTEVESKIV